MKSNTNAAHAHKPSGREENKKSRIILQGVICYVETINADGTNATPGIVDTLLELGATTQESINLNLTHVIWSYGNPKLLKAARALEIPVVSPLWVEQCREAGRKVDENDFLVPENADTTTLKVVEPKINQLSAITENANRNSKLADPELKKSRELKKSTIKQSDISKRLFSEATLDLSFTDARIAFSGFEGEERALLQDVVQAVIERSFEKRKATQTLSKVMVNDDEPLEAISSCTHLVIPKENERRTLRVMEALVRHIPIVTEDWIFESLDHLSENNTCWSNCQQYLHPRFQHHYEGAVKERLSIRVYVGPCDNPPKDKLCYIIESSDYLKLTFNIDDADIIVLGEISTNFQTLAKHLSEYKVRLTKMREEGCVVVCKTFFDLIENDKLIEFAASKKRGQSKENADPFQIRLDPIVSPTVTTTVKRSSGTDSVSKTKKNISSDATRANPLSAMHSPLNRTYDDDNKEDTSDNESLVW